MPDILTQKTSSTQYTFQLQDHGDILGDRMRGTQADNLWRVWLACVLSLYPAYWLASFLLFAAPALTRVALSGQTLTSINVSLQGISATSTSADPAPMRRGPGNPSIPIALGIALAVGLFARKQPIFAGVILAMIGAEGLSSGLMRIVFGNRWTPETLFGFAVFFAILCFGLRSMLTGFWRDSYWTRAGMLYAAYVLPAAIVLLAGGLMIFRRPVPAYYALLLVAPASIASLLVSIWPQRRKTDRHVAVKWHPIAALAAIALLIAGVGNVGAQAFQRAKGEANRAALAAIPPIPQNLPYPKLFFQKGVNFTAEFPGGYPSENARQMLRSLPKHGVNAIALVPYGFSERSSGHVGWVGGLEREDSMEQLSRVAHQLNIKVLLKPQIWVRQGFPGDLEFSSAQIRNQWFTEYLRFVEHYAEMAKRIHADLFCVGVEFQKLVKYDSNWRKIIARAREIYPGPLVYAATQGPEFESIKFWDQLDYIGLNNYYPLPDDLSTDAIVRKVELVQHAFKKPVIFTEAGFSSFESPHREPWAEKPGRISLAEQARCYEAVLQAFFRKPWFQGVYWWKVGTDGHGGSEDGSLTPWGKPAMDVVTRWYLQGGR